MKKQQKLIVGISILGVIILGYFGYKKMNQVKTSGGSDTTSGGGGNTTPTTSPLDFQSLANQLFQAFDGCGTKNSVWRSVIKELNNQADWDALSSAYGSKKLSCGYLWKTYEGNLAGAFKNELGSSELKELNDMLKSKNINI